ncbi:MAG: uroporphyrinogen-III synthase [Thermoproteaceae archaeon]|nr:uroporphyrinogen-III synthase [Thermoproteaceae archaeon]
MEGGAEIVVIRIKEGPCPGGAVCAPVGRAIPRRDVTVPEGDYLVVMSPVAASAVDVAALRRKFKRVICIGPSTARAVGDCEIPREYTSYGVAELLSGLAPGRVVVLRSSSGNDILRSLTPGVIEVPVYDVEIDPERARAAARLIAGARAVVFASSLAAEAVAGLADMSGKVVVAIGPVTSRALSRLGVRHATASSATIGDAVRLAAEILRGRGQR